MSSFVRETPNHFSLPRRIARLGDLAYNLWWAWNPEALRLFARIDRTLWEQVYHNPVAFLRRVERRHLNAATNDRYFLESYDAVIRAFDQYMAEENTWFRRTYPQLTSQQIAYFSFEFGLHESLPVYAGGLGVLAGDHLKEASDLGLPLAGVGFYYTQGYFSQKITEDGWQETRNLRLNYEELPVVPLVHPEGGPLMVSVTLAGRKVFARILQIQVGRVPLFLLDTDVESNTLADRSLTARLYTSDQEVRISQEILLGIGGLRALRLLGYDPTVWHMNEGHSAFLTIQRLREYVAQGFSLEEARERIRKTNIFTTHTPVPAGNDEFPLWMMDKYFSHVYNELKMDRDLFIDLGRNMQEWGETFSMPVLALRLSEKCNAVSELHGRVSRRMWHKLWADRKEDDVPIFHITNGVHVGTWMARRWRLLFERYLGMDWMDNLDDPEMWMMIDNIPDAEIWAVRRHLKNKLVHYAIERARRHWVTGEAHPVQVVAGGVLLEPYSLTIGFARRFATYKRANLIMRDVDRLIRIITNAEMPVQIIFAGKAHPADEPGKLLIQQVYRAVKDSRAGGRLVFLEDYDMNLARLLVQGVDVWMNTPRRPNEASGTSGMKAAMNGVLNFSVLDGWWREGYNGKNGWAIGEEKDYADPNEQDEHDAQSLYATLENEIIPLYYGSRAGDDIPHAWIERIKESMRTLIPQFSTRRMLKEYLQQAYLPAMEAALQMEALPGEKKP
ncbi:MULTISPECIES: alpha-glucan family phosphorylase [Anaerolinea]|uniref:alpha-glucan family phosphorylase n=1 Tax=Anaerolinea TaxID=233189 RepID=UPI00261ED59C|nr:alpha-glucan family phosphorylase [Anaerolinea thermophila]